MAVECLEAKEPVIAFRTWWRPKQSKKKTKKLVVNKWLFANKLPISTLHQSATALKPLISEVNNVEYLVTRAPVKRE